MKKEPRKRKRYRRLMRIDYQLRTKLWSITTGKLYWCALLVLSWS